MRRVANEDGFGFGDDREEYLNWYRNCLDDARSVAEETGEILDHIVHLLAVNMLMTFMARSAEHIAARLDAAIREVSEGENW